VVDAVNLDRAEAAMRNWQGAEPGQLRIGSDSHKRLFCRMLLETHHPYDPMEIAWPELRPDDVQRLAKLPIWDTAVHKESCATARVQAFARLENDALVRQALELDAREEARHEAVLTCLAQAYRIPLSPRAQLPAPKDPERAWMLTGLAECIDVFFAFGFFEVARRSGLFPAELVDTFEPVIQEECRHILFFANWMAWYRRNMPRWRRPLFAFKALRLWLLLVRERIAMARGIGARRHTRDVNFTVTGSKSVGIKLKARDLITLCLAENDRRMAGYDSRLLRPTTVPRLARLIQRLLPAA
jgi:hypothetical protein